MVYFYLELLSCYCTMHNLSFVELCVCVNGRGRGVRRMRRKWENKISILILYLHMYTICLYVLSLTYSSLPPSAPPPKRRRVTAARDIVDDHVTGCARSEGYYKIDMRDKVKYLPHHRDRPKDGPQPKQAVSTESTVYITHYTVCNVHWCTCTHQNIVSISFVPNFKFLMISIIVIHCICIYLWWSSRDWLPIITVSWLEHLHVP